jgi:hypothetical protein
MAVRREAGETVVLSVIQTEVTLDSLRRESLTLA